MAYQFAQRIMTLEASPLRENAKKYGVCSSYFLCLRISTDRSISNGYIERDLAKII